MFAVASWLAAIWIAIVAIAEHFPNSSGSIYAGGIGASVTIGLFYANREQGRRKLTLDLHKEYYSKEMAEERRAAARLMKAFKSVDWSANDPYRLGRGDDDLAGYGAVIRFWHRVAVLYSDNEINRALTVKLFARELGEWHARIFYPMRNRRGMYVLPAIKDLCVRVQYGTNSRSFREGYDAAMSSEPPEHTVSNATRVQSRAERWSTL